MGSSDNNRLELIALEKLREYSTIVPKTILEVGSQHGQDAERLRKHFDMSPNDVYIVEAHPDFYTNICKEFPFFNVFNFAAGDCEKMVEFNAALNADDGRSSVLGRDIYDPKIFKKVEVPMIRLDGFFGNVGISSVDIFKLDVEGFSLEVLRGCGKMLRNIKCIQVETEYGQMWDRQSVTLDNYKFLTENGYSLVWHHNIANLQDDSIWIRKEYLR